LVRAAVQHTLAGRECRIARRCFDHDAEPEAADDLEHGDGITLDGRRRRPVGRRDADERNRRPRRTAVAGETPVQRQEIGNGHQPVAVRIGSRAAGDGTAIHIRDQVAVAVGELVAKLIDVRRRHQTVAIHITGKGRNGDRRYP